MATILVIDDDGLFRDIAGTALREAGHKVEESVDGKAGAERFAKGGIDLVIVDMYMPAQDGIDTIFEMDAAAKGVRVIAVTGGHSMGADSLQLAQSAGADLTMEKGFAPEELVQAVADLLSKRKK